MRTKNTYLRSMFHRLKSCRGTDESYHRRGRRNSAVECTRACGLATKTIADRFYPNHYTARERAKRINRHLRGLDALGIKVTQFHDESERLVSSSWTTYFAGSMLIVTVELMLISMA